jgi:hypothetical protein
MEGSLVAYKVFSNGSVLNASEINDNLMNQSIAVFSNAAARTAAISSPVEGQMTYLEDVNLYQAWNGTSWVSPFGLTLIKSQVLGSGISTVTISDVFSADYDDYKIIINGGTASTSLLLNMTLGASTTGYYLARQAVRYDTVAQTLNTNNNSANWTGVGSGETTGVNGSLELLEPFLASRTKINTWRMSQGTTGSSGAGAGYHDVAASYTSFTLATNTGTISSATIKVYGYKKA